MRQGDMLQSISSFELKYAVREYWRVRHILEVLGEEQPAGRPMQADEERVSGGVPWVRGGEDRKTCERMVGWRGTLRQGTGPGYICE